MDTCSVCHSRRSDLTGEFKPGDSFFDHQEMMIVDGTDGYYADGQVHDEDYEFASFLSSRMHTNGVTCMDCHQPHSAKTILPGNLLCLRCHNGSNPQRARSARSGCAQLSQTPSAEDKRSFGRSKC